MRPVVVVACSESDAPALTAVVRGLVARNLRVELVPLNDSSVQPLEVAVERFGTGATYVVCHTAALDRYQADLCDLTIRAAEIPAERIVSAWFSADDPEAFASAVGRRVNEDSLPEIREVLQSETPPEKPAPEVAVHTPAPAAEGSVVQPRSHESSTSTSVAMRRALGWRRILPSGPMSVLLAVAIVAGVIYFGGYAEPIRHWIRTLWL